MNGLIKNKRCGFTMIELTMTAVVVGIIISVTAAKLPTAIEKERSKAGQRVLVDTYASQNRYRIDNGAYANSVNDLDMSFRGLNGFTVAVSNNASAVVSVTRQNSNPYTLTIASTGAISCTGSFCGNISYNNVGSPGGGNITAIDPDSDSVDSCITNPDAAGCTQEEETDPCIANPDATGCTQEEDPATEITYEEIMSLYEASPLELSVWVEKNPEEWAMLQEEFPELQELILPYSYEDATAMFNETPSELIAWVEQNPKLWDQMVEENPDLQDMVDKAIHQQGDETILKEPILEEPAPSPQKECDLPPMMAGCTITWTDPESCVFETSCCTDPCDPNCDSVYDPNQCQEKPAPVPVEIKKWRL